MNNSPAAQIQVDARKLAGLLADEKRLRVVAAIALGANTVGAIGSMAGLDDAAVARALARLQSGGLVEGGTATGYRLRTEVFRSAARGVGGVAARSSALAAVVRNGRLPRSRADRLVVLGEMAALFEAGKRYPEKEVNERLRVVNPDYALMRRYLIDEGFLERANEVNADGRTVMVYWRTYHG